MPNKKNDETLQEILEEDNTIVRKSKRKNGIARILLILTIPIQTNKIPLQTGKGFIIVIIYSI